MRTVKKPRGGSIGKGTRKGTHRSPLAQATYDWDVDGFQLASLTASAFIFRDDASRLGLCLGSGRHMCGLVLVRPRRPRCSATECLCSADTVAMAARIGADKTKVCSHGCLSPASRARPSADTFRALLFLQVVGWWSKQVTAARQDATQPTQQTSASDDECEPRSPSARHAAG